MELRRLLLVLSLLYLSSGEHHQELTVCPEGYPDSEDCKTLDQLVSDKLILSNTIFKFVPATFQIKPNTIISFTNVSNITLQAASPHSDGVANVSCTGGRSGFVFSNVSGLTVRNFQFISCDYNGTLVLQDSADILLQDVGFKKGANYGVLALDACVWSLDNS